MTLIPPILTPQQEQAYRQQREAAQQSYGANVAQNNFQASSATAQYHQNLADLTRQLQKMRSAINPAFARRGMLRSGLFHRAINEDAANQLSQLARLQLGQQQNLGNQAIQNQLASSQYATSQANINSSRMNALAALVQSMKIPGA